MAMESSDTSPNASNIIAKFFKNVEDVRIVCKPPNGGRVMLSAKCVASAG